MEADLRRFGMEVKMNYKVYQDDTELKIRTASIYPSPYLEKRKMEYLQFPVSGPTLLTVRSAAAVHSAVIRPLSLGLKPELEDGLIRIRLDGPVKFSLEINGSYRDNLLVLAEKPAYEDAPACWAREKEEGRLLTSPRECTTRESLRSRGMIRWCIWRRGLCERKAGPDHCDRVTVCGYGVLTMEKYPLEMRNVYQRCVNAMYCKDLTIRDITITDSNDWSLRINGCENVLVDNVKIIGCRGNSDGVDVCGSRMCWCRAYSPGCGTIPSSLRRWIPEMWKTSYFGTVSCGMTSQGPWRWAWSFGPIM